jgi:hypothetical protein
MESNILRDLLLFTHIMAALTVLFWFSRDSPKRRRTAVVVAMGIAVAWVLDHL